jgi:hypothetical protein
MTSNKEEATLKFLRRKKINGEALTAHQVLSPRFICSICQTYLIYQEQMIAKFTLHSDVSSKPVSDGTIMKQVWI